MIRNYYYLVAGILSILFSFTHAWNGETNFLPIINASGLDLTSQTIIFYIWHILTAENLILGVALFVMSVHQDSSKIKFTAWMIAFILIARWTVILASTLFKNKNGVGDTLTDSIAIIVFVGLLILGARKKQKVRG